MTRTIPENGLVVTNAQEDSLRRVIDKGCWTPVEAFGGEDSWHATNAKRDGAFDVMFAGEKLGTVNWTVIGEHNRMNALASIAAARHVGVPVAESIAALGEFKNVKRRMELRGVVNDISIYDDFAHHPTAITTTVAGLRAKVGKARILAVLEPRSNTMKMGAMKAALPDSLQAADIVFCYGENLDWDLEAAMQPIAEKAHVMMDLDALLHAVVSTAKPGDHILVMSNGGFGGIHQKLIDAL